MSDRTIQVGLFVLSFTCNDLMLSALFCSDLLSSIPLFFMRRPWHATNFPLHFLKK